MTSLSLFGLALMLMAMFLENWASETYQSFIDLAIFGIGFALLIVGNA